MLKKKIENNSIILIDLLMHILCSPLKMKEQVTIMEMVIQEIRFG